jgi:hypothetical protein
VVLIANDSLCEPHCLGVNFIDPAVASGTLSPATRQASV